MLDEFGAYPAMINREIERYLPFLATTKLLMAAVKVGVGREKAHGTIKRNAVAAALSMRTYGDANSLVATLAADPTWPLSMEATRAALGNPMDFTGLANAQVAEVVGCIQKLCDAHPGATAYTPEPIL